MKASEVLQECIEDIDAGKWVCGYLHQKKLDKGPNGTEMGCAVGLVSINSGDTKTVRVTKKDIPNWMREEGPTQEVNIVRENGRHSGASCDIHSQKGIKPGDEFEVARYPKEGSPQVTKDSIKYLYDEVPEGYKPPWKTITLANQVSAVVDYNDGSMESERDAKSWFVAARDKALADNN